MNKYDYKYLNPFKWFILENFPFIEADFDALTNWQLFCKLGKEMNKIIDNLNSLGIETENLSQAFIDLQNYVNDYFENLDVQEEINTKLDEMAEGGELTELIAQYLQLQGLLCYNNLNELKNANNIAEGSFVKTYGTNQLGDGIMYFYKIRQITNTDVVDNLQIISLANYPTLIAERISNFITNDKTNPIFYGADPTGQIDSSVAINNCILANKGGTINFSQGTYIVNQTINLPYNQTEKVNINGNGAKIINNATLDRLFYVGYDKGLSGRNDVGFPSYIKDLFVDGTNSETTYCIDIVLGYKDLKIYNCRFYSFLNGVRIGETVGSAADVLMNDCLLYGKGSEFDGTGIIANCTDNNINMCRIYGFRKGFIINGATVVKECHVLLRWKEQTTANPDPYPRNGVEFNTYYPLTMFAEVNNYLRLIDSYGDSIYKMLEINTTIAVVVIGSIYFNARGDVDNRLFDIIPNTPKLILDNSTFDCGKNTECEIIHLRQPINNLSQIKLGNTIITNIQRLSNPADLILSTQPQLIANKPMLANTWYLVKIIANNSDYNTLKGNLYINGYEYSIRMVGGANKQITSITQLLKGTGNSTWTIGTVTINGNIYLCIKSNQATSGTKFDYKTSNMSTIVFDVTPIKDNNVASSSRLLSDYTDLVPTTETQLLNILV